MGDLDAKVNAYLVWPIARSEVWVTLVSELEDGGQVRRQKLASPKYLFECETVFETKSEAETFLTFFNGKAGSAQSFTWEPPDQFDTGSYTTCYFPDDALRLVMEGPRRWRYLFRVQAE